jgi:hypothetical protein
MIKFARLFFKFIRLASCIVVIIQYQTHNPFVLSEQRFIQKSKTEKFLFYVNIKANKS